ncbi:MAG: sulfate ABC transporter permease subunit CysT [Lachnospiraceae bacterium]|nr:sulfate ABC transporter permease subunit CysT [Lachnospiraceae bacterium]
MNKGKQRRVIPGFGLTFGITISMLSVIVLIPLCSLIIYSAKLSPAEFWGIISGKRVLHAYFVSMSTACIASLINAGIGLIMAWVLVRYEFPGKKIMDGMIELPFALPTAVAGIALTHLTTKEGWIGAFFDRFGIQIAYTKAGIVFALVFVGIPFVVRSVQPVLEKLDGSYEEAMEILGGTPAYTFVKVILPEILPALIGGFTMAFARCLGEYGSVVFIAGNKPMDTEIAPLMIMSKLQEFDYEAATAIALLMLLTAFVILLLNSAFQYRAARMVK